MSRFQKERAQKWCNNSGVLCTGLIDSKVLYNFWKKFRRYTFRFWSYSNSNIGDRNVCAQILPRTILWETFYVTILTSKIEPTSQITHFCNLSTPSIIPGWLSKNGHFWHNLCCVLPGGKKRAYSYYILHTVCFTQKHTDNKHIKTMKWA